MIFTVSILHDEYGVLGSRRMDCIGRWESGRAYRAIASQFQGLRITPNVYTTLSELDRFVDQVQLITQKGIPS